MLGAILLSLLSACAAPALHDADILAREGRNDDALTVLDAARQRDPSNLALRAATQRQRELTIAVLASRAEAARTAGRLDEAATLLGRLDVLDATHPRALALHAELADDRRRQQLQERAARRPITATTRSAAPTPAPPASAAKRITLEFRDAALRNVFESIGRSLGVNFAFDKEVHGDAKITVFLTDVTLDDALRVILATQQLDAKQLNDHAYLVYPNTPIKQQEHQDLVTRSFYLVNADVKQAQQLVKTMAKTRDVYVDERLNLLIVRDTQAVINLTERLIAAIDLPDPEVTLEVEVLEVGTTQLEELGLQWPDTVQYGVPNMTGQVTGGFRASIANPAVTATLRGTVGSSNLIANPKLRARNHEKAHVQIGERLPIFTSSTVALAGVATNVSYIDTGLKLEVEPSVQLDNDVVMKVSLEVSNLIGTVQGPQGSLAYQVGTRNATTSLRLRDGETQVLAGLINDEDTKAVQGIPYLSELPVLGRLFGTHRDSRNKSEIVLLITPRIVRNLALRDAERASSPAGTYANPGAMATHLGPLAGVALPLAGGSAAGGGAGPNDGNGGAGGDGGAGPRASQGDTSAAAGTDATPGAPADASVAPPAAAAVVELSTSGEAVVGGTVSVSVQNRSRARVRGRLHFDATLLKSAGADVGDGIDFDLDATGQQVLVLRVLPAAAGKSTQIEIDTLSAVSASGAALPAEVHGDGALNVAGK